MYLTLVFEQAQCNAVHWSITPPLIKEPTRSIQVLKVVFVWFGTPKLHIRDFKIAPKVTRAVAIRFYVVFWPPLTVHDPLSCVVLMQILRVCRYEFLRLRPQRGNRLGGIVEVDGKPVGFVVITHPAEDIVIDIAEKVHFGLHTPVIADVLEGWVLVEHATVPTAHLVVGYHRAILDILFLEHLCRFVEQVAVDPLWDCPMFFGYDFYTMVNKCEADEEKYDTP